MSPARSPRWIFATRDAGERRAVKRLLVAGHHPFARKREGADFVAAAEKIKHEKQRLGADGAGWQMANVIEGTLEVARRPSREAAAEFAGAIAGIGQRKCAAELGRGIGA